MNAENPFQAPPFESYSTDAYDGLASDRGLTPPATRQHMEWGQSISYLFAEPNWIVTLLLAAVCNLIPILGAMVVMGYQFETTIELTCSRGQRYRPFDFNRFLVYLKRGVWPFLGAFLTGLCVAFAMYVAMILFVVLLAAASDAAGRDAGPPIFFTGLAVGLVVLIGTTILLNLTLQPMLLRVALTQDLTQAFNLAFVSDFMEKVRWEMLLGVFFQMAVGLACGLLGLATCGVGLYAVAVVMMLIQAHLLYQYYELYRARGGMVIPLTLID